MNARRGLSFSEVEIQKLFGHEAAENEDPARLRDYYFKTSIYEQGREKGIILNLLPNQTFRPIADSDG